MRDILTALAGLVIVLLTAALVAPPLIDWDLRRAEVEQALSRAAGAPIETAGPLDVRLLPSPRITVGSLAIGGGEDAATLVAEDVTAAIELAPLLRGQVRFSTGRAAQAEIRVPARGAEGLRLPAALAPGARTGAVYAFEDLRADRLSIVAVSPEMGARRWALLADVRLSADALGGPYRIEGTTQGVPFRLVTGRFDADSTMQLRVVVGGDDTPVRVDAEAALSLEATGGGFYAGALRGKGRLVLAAAQPDSPPLTLTTDYATAPGGVELADLAIETGDPGAGTRLDGSGFLRLDDPRLSLVLSTRRLVLERLLESPLGRLLGEAGDGALPLPVALRLSADNLALLGDEIESVVLDVSAEGETLTVQEATGVLPGSSRVGFVGDVALGRAPRVDGRASLLSQDSARLARFLRDAGVDGAALDLLDGQPVDVDAEVAWSPGLLALSDLRLAAGGTQITGGLSYAPGRGGGRPSLDAQISADGLDVARLPQLSALSGLPSELDVTLSLDAEDVRFEGAEGAGRIRARLQSRGEGLVVEALEVSNLAGARVSVSGRIDEDGTGRIAGRLVAVEAEPLIALLGGVAFGDAVALIPGFIRDGALDVALTVERLAEADGTGGLRTGIEGLAAGGPITAQWVTRDGRTERLDVAVSTDDTRRWLDIDHSLVAGRPSRLDVSLGRSGPDRYVGVVDADVAGLRITTPRPLALDAIDLSPLDGEIALRSEDLRPALALLGGRVVAEAPLPTDLRAALARTGLETTLQAGGTVAGQAVRADLAWPLGGDPTGEIRLERLSLPWLAQTLALGDVLGERSGPWSREAFAALSRPVSRGSATVVADALALGRGFVAQGARFDLAVTRDGLTLTGLEGALADGRIAADLVFRRPTAESASLVGEASLADLSFSAIDPDLAIEGRITGTLEFGGVGGNVAELVGALSGEGRFTIADLVVPRADPGAIRRGLTAALQEDDPLGGRRIDTYVGAALDEAPFRAETLEAPATLVSGVLDLSPLAVAAAGAPGSFEGAAAVDLRSLTLELRGFLRSPAAPQGWEGPEPMIGIAFSGEPGALERTIDVGPLTNGIAAIVLQRELARIEAFEREASERQRRIDQARMLDLRRERAEAWRLESERRRIEEMRRRGAAEASRREAEALSLDSLEEERARRAEEERLRLEAEAAAEAQRRREEEARAAEAERLRLEAEAAAEAQRRREEEARETEAQPAQDAWATGIRELILRDEATRPQVSEPPAAN